jgi:hypothetical protein
MLKPNEPQKRKPRGNFESVSGQINLEKALDENIESALPFLADECEQLWKNTKPDMDGLITPKNETE